MKPQCSQYRAWVKIGKRRAPFPVEYFLIEINRLFEVRRRGDGSNTKEEALAKRACPVSAHPNEAIAHKNTGAVLRSQPSLWARTGVVGLTRLYENIDTVECIGQVTLVDEDGIHPRAAHRLDMVGHSAHKDDMVT